MIIEARLLYAQRWKVLTLSTMEEWVVKLAYFVEMNKLTSLIREKKSTFIADWKPLMDLL